MQRLLQKFGNLAADHRYYALACVALGGMGQGVVAPNLSMLLKNSKVALADSGIGAGLLYLGIFLSTYLYGKMADRGKVHLLFAAGLLVYSITLFLLGIAGGSSAAFFLIRFVEGLAISAVFVAGDFVLGRLSKEHERARWLSYYGVALSIGLLVGPALSLFAAKIFNHRSPAITLGLVAGGAVLLAGASFRVRVESLRDVDSSSIKWPTGPLVSGASYGFMEAGVVAVFPILAATDLSVTPEYCLIAIIISAALSSIVFGELAERVDSSVLVRLLLLGMSAGFLALTLILHRVSPVTWAYSAGAFIGILAGGLYPLGFDWLLKRVPASEYGNASGAFARAYGLGSLLGPFALGYSTQFAHAAGMSAPLAVVGILAFLISYSRIFR